MAAKKQARKATRRRAQAARVRPARRPSMAAARQNLILQSLELGRNRAVQILARYRKTAKRRHKELAEAAARMTPTRTFALRPAELLIFKGDSWFDYGRSDIIDLLQSPAYGYVVDGYALTGSRIVDLAHDRQQLDELCNKIADHCHHGNVPKAILLSGGGNDIADNFEALLYHKNSAQSGWNMSLVDGFVGSTLKQAYATVVSALDKFCNSLLDRSVPIVVHGYARPVPDGRGVFAWDIGWLKPGFLHQGYLSQQERIDLAGAFIDKFNEMLSRLKAETGIASVVYADVRPALSSGRDWTTWWTNELHPTNPGFQAVTQIIAGKL